MSLFVEMQLKYVYYKRMYSEKSDVQHLAVSRERARELMTRLVRCYGGSACRSDIKRKNGSLFGLVLFALLNRFEVFKSSGNRVF